MQRKETEDVVWLQPSAVVVLAVESLLLKRGISIMHRSPLQWHTHDTS